MKKIIPSSNIIDILRCPICNNQMQLQVDPCSGIGKSLICTGARRHCYDFSAEGYVNLMPPGHTSGGDSKQAVRARTDFLNQNYYQPVVKKLADVLVQYVIPKDHILLDAGCGDGYYTEYMSQKGFTVMGVDISRPAVAYTAKRLAQQGIVHAFAGVSGIFDLPFAENSVDVITNIFAPCAEAEFMRVLKPGGILAVVYAGPHHLSGLKKKLYQEVYDNDERSDLPVRPKCLDKISVHFDISVDGVQNVKNLFAMTPYYWRTSPMDSEKLNALHCLTTEVDMVIAIYRKSEVV